MPTGPVRPVCTLVAALGLLAGCVPQTAQAPAVEFPVALTLRPIDYASLPGWSDDPISTMLPALLRDCRRLALLPPDASLGGTGAAGAAGGKAGNWAPFCRAVQAVPASDSEALRHVVEAWLQAYALGDRGAEEAQFTGYFEPEYPGSLSRTARYTIPVYRRPPDLQGLKPYWSRAQIDQGALAGRGLEIAYLADPADLYFLQVQGSGRIRLPSGQIIRLGYAGRNGAPYTPLGRLLVGAHELAADDVSMASIRGWLASHPWAAAAMMELNENYVFFRSLDDLRPSQGPIGALGIDLQPERSIAVDGAYLPLAAPVWIDTTDPDGRILQRLTLAQDLGTDIKGPVRADLFFGWGGDAARLAGSMHAGGRLTILLPRPPAAPAADQPAGSDDPP